VDLSFVSILPVGLGWRGCDGLSVVQTDRPMGFKVTKGAGSAKKAKASQRKARAEDFVWLLADDAEKNFGKMIPFTQERRDRIAALLEEVELDPIE
jgi:hypothetical protein